MNKSHFTLEIYKTFRQREEMRLDIQQIIDMIDGLLSVLEPINCNEQESLGAELYDIMRLSENIGKPKTEILEIVSNMLDGYIPRNKERFAGWGYPDQKSTVDECWI